MLRAGPGGADADGAADGAAAAAPLEAAARLAASSGAARRGVLWSSAPARFTPREAYYMPRRVLPAVAAVGRASADLVCPYPPGIPVLVPGDAISAEALRQLQWLRDAGCVISGCADPTLATLAVLDERDPQGGIERDQGELERDSALTMRAEALASTRDQTFDGPLREAAVEAIEAAIEAVASPAGPPLSASQITTAFEAWKGAAARKYDNADGEARALRAFAANEDLVREYLPEAEP